MTASRNACRYASQPGGVGAGQARAGRRPALTGAPCGGRGQDHNGAGVVAHWRFTTTEARIKLHKLYPTLDP
jgi:hypothetical protein